jgi:uncharacterized protein involved in outer membrane biogenesis
MHRDPLWDGYDTMGPTEVARRLNPHAHDAFNAANTVSATAWQEDKRQRTEAVSNASNSELIELTRRQAAAAEAAAAAERDAADAARLANRHARTANIIAAAALIVATIAMACAIVALRRSGGG